MASSVEAMSISALQGSVQSSTAKFNRNILITPDFNGCVPACPPLQRGEVRVLGITIDAALVKSHFQPATRAWETAREKAIQDAKQPKKKVPASRKKKPPPSQPLLEVPEVEIDEEMGQRILTLMAGDQGDQAKGVQSIELVKNNIIKFLQLDTSPNAKLIPLNQDPQVQGVTIDIVPPDDMREGLRGGKGLFAKQDMSPGFVVGVYRSCAQLQTPHDHMAMKQRPPTTWKKSRPEWEMHVESYCFSDPDLVVAPTGNPDQPCKETKRRSLYFDGVGYGNACALANDPTIFPPEFFSMDGDVEFDVEWEDWYWDEAPKVQGGGNCSIITVLIRGWPYPFMIATKRIIAGQELLYEYGAGYWSHLATLCCRATYHTDADTTLNVSEHPTQLTSQLQQAAIEGSGVSEVGPAVQAAKPAASMSIVSPSELSATKEPQSAAARPAAGTDGHEESEVGEEEDHHGDGHRPSRGRRAAGVARAPNLEVEWELTGDGLDDDEAQSRPQAAAAVSASLPAKPDAMHSAGERRGQQRPAARAADSEHDSDDDMLDCLFGSVSAVQQQNSGAHNRAYWDEPETTQRDGYKELLKQLKKSEEGEAEDEEELEDGEDEEVRRQKRFKLARHSRYLMQLERQLVRFFANKQQKHEAMQWNPDESKRPTKEELYASISEIKRNIKFRGDVQPGPFIRARGYLFKEVGPAATDSSTATSKHRTDPRFLMNKEAPDLVCSRQGPAFQLPLLLYKLSIIDYMQACKRPRLFLSELMNDKVLNPDIKLFIEMYPKVLDFVQAHLCTTMDIKGQRQDLDFVLHEYPEVKGASSQVLELCINTLHKYQSVQESLRLKGADYRPLLCTRLRDNREERCEAGKICRHLHGDLVRSAQIRRANPTNKRTRDQTA